MLVLPELISSSCLMHLVAISYASRPVTLSLLAASKKSCFWTLQLHPSIYLRSWHQKTFNFCEGWKFLHQDVGGGDGVRGRSLTWCLTRNSSRQSRLSRSIMVDTPISSCHFSGSFIALFPQTLQNIWMQMLIYSWIIFLMHSSIKVKSHAWIFSILNTVTQFWDCKNRLYIYFLLSFHAWLSFYSILRDNPFTDFRKRLRRDESPLMQRKAASMVYFTIFSIYGSWSLFLLTISLLHTHNSLTTSYCVVVWGI